MNVFLAGAIKTGKSTIISSVCEAVTSRGGKIGGFQSYFDERRAEEDRCLYLNGVYLPKLNDEEHVVARFFPKKEPKVNVDRFNKFGKIYIKECKKSVDLLIMDECSFLEGQALDFQKEILAALNETTPILGVVRLGKAKWTQQIVNHPNVRIIEVTEENRNELRIELIDYYTSRIQRFPE